MFVLLSISNGFNDKFEDAYFVTLACTVNDRLFTTVFYAIWWDINVMDISHIALFIFLFYL